MLSGFISCFRRRSVAKFIKLYRLYRSQEFMTASGLSGLCSFHCRVKWVTGTASSGLRAVGFMFRRFRVSKLDNFGGACVAWGYGLAWSHIVFFLWRRLWLFGPKPQNPQTAPENLPTTLTRKPWKPWRLKCGRANNVKSYLLPTDARTAAGGTGLAVRWSPSLRAIQTLKYEAPCI